MKTVKEIAELTGISVRTLHYYDEIGLLDPSSKTEAGYRLYDEKAMETLQQILFFREFELPLKEIKGILTHPALDRNQILQMQRKMLCAKKERLERLIASIDDILKGANAMDFQVFNRSEIEEMFEGMYKAMPEEIRQKAIEEYGSREQWKEHYIQTVSKPKNQKRYAKIIAWAGGKEAYKKALESSVQPVDEKQFTFAKREIEIRDKLLAKRGSDVNSYEVRAIIGEYAYVMKLTSQIENEKESMLSLAKSYRDEKIAFFMDEEYGQGASAFIADAIEAYYSQNRN